MLCDLLYNSLNWLFNEFMKINVENLFVDIELKITDKKHRIQVLEL